METTSLILAYGLVLAAWGISSFNELGLERDIVWSSIRATAGDPSSCSWRTAHGQPVPTGAPASSGGRQRCPSPSR